ncbi:MAG TPA: alpha/beta fold hydrolase [Candidatus Limnocylindrales bacterium]|nr:alpha/beta fold hydrolase [Candidatus Limnocylindrales bacterium]
MTWFADRRLAEHARATPDEPALVDGDRTLTWATLDGLASSVAASVAGAGVVPGERVALLGPADAVDCAAILGILRAGAVVAPVPAGLTARETAIALDVLAPALVLRLGDVVPAGTPFEPASPGRDPEAPAVVVLTSGTTGRPRGVVLSSRAMAASAEAWMAALPPATGWAMPLGLGHVAGLGILWRAMRDRVPVRIVPGHDPLLLLAALHGTRPGVSHVSLVAAQLARALDEARGVPPPSSLRAALLGGGPIPPELVTRALRAGWPVIPTYGLSETASGATALATEDAWDLPGSAGAPLPGVHLALADEDETGVGEIVLQATSRFSGYLGEDDGDGGRAPVDAPFRTGDLGRLDRQGRLAIVDRRVDRIVRGGENVSPAEIEAVLATHPAIAEACVVGVPDAVMGHVPAAAIVLRDGAEDPGDAALTAHVRALLAKFKIPARFARLDVLPRTPGGKLRREAVRALLAGERAGELARPGGDAIGWRVTGDGPRTIILLHGTLSTAAQLDRLAAALAEPGDVTVHALDRRGSGSSRLATPRPLDMAVHVADVCAYLDARGIDRADLVGVSFGGVLALELAARRPDRVRAIVAYEPPYGLLADEAGIAWFQRVAADTAAAHAERGSAAAAATFLRHVAGDAAWERLPSRARVFLEAEGDGALADTGLTGLDADGLARIEAPVTIITGGASAAFYVPLADALAGRIRGARRDTLEGLTHTAPITQPGAIAPAVRAALEAIA